jgi:hypothetical protein
VRACTSVCVTSSVCVRACNSESLLSRARGQALEKGAGMEAAYDRMLECNHKFKTDGERLFA